jgi:transposase-like protein
LGPSIFFIFCHAYCTFIFDLIAGLRFLAKGDKAFVGKGRVTPEEAEIRGLRKELEKVKEERDILKKALAVFSKRNR